MHHEHDTYWQTVWKNFSKRSLGIAGLVLIFLFVLAGIYAPILASSKPLALQFEGQWYFPLFRYLFYPGFFTKRLDIFYNLLMFTFPLFCLAWVLFRKSHYRTWVIACIAALQCLLFLFLIVFPPRNPEFNPLHAKNQTALNWKEELSTMTPYTKIKLILRYMNYRNQNQQLLKHADQYAHLAESMGQTNSVLPTLWNLTFGQEHARQHIASPERIRYERDRFAWLEHQSKKIEHIWMPLIRPFHWEDDAGGDQTLNRLVDWWDLTRINGKDMISSLIFGIRISLSVGLLAIGLALLIGIPIGALAGYYGGKLDLATYRLIEIWESMPTFFMLLMIVAFFRSKSIFMIIAVIGLFGWTSFSRFVRGEFFRQKELLYVEACKALGYRDSRIIFSHLLPNALPPLLTLVPFAIMGAITTEAGLSFLGLGEEGSNSWGVLMDEGRSAFPAESYLLWPPAILLTILLVAIALVGDALRDALDPKLHIH